MFFAAAASGCPEIDRSLISGTFSFRPDLAKGTGSNQAPQQPFSICFGGHLMLAGDEAEALDVFVQVLQREFGMRCGFDVVEPEPREVRNEDAARQIAVGDAGEIIEGLDERAVEILAARLVLDDQLAFPERLRFGPLALGVLPCARKGDRFIADFRPGDGHAVWSLVFVGTSTIARVPAFNLDEGELT